MTTIAAEFESYRQTCHPKAPPTIVEMLRQAFVAGACTAVIEAGKGPEDFQFYAKTVLDSAGVLAGHTDPEANPSRN